MNAFASRGVDAGFGRMMKKPRLSKRPRTFIAALVWARLPCHPAVRMPMPPLLRPAILHVP